jgi:antitoxin ParD1/3/4
MPTMNVNLTPEMAEYVSAELKSGDYASASELVREALRVLKRDREVEAEKLALLRAAIDAGIEDAEQGRFSDRSVSDIVKGVLNKAG